MHHLISKRRLGVVLAAIGLCALMPAVASAHDNDDENELPEMTSVKGSFAPGSAIEAQFPCGDPQNSVGSLMLIDMQEQTVASNQLPGAVVPAEFVIDVVIPPSIEPGTELALLGECATEGDVPTEINFAPVEIVVASSVEVPATGSSSTTLATIAGALLLGGVGLTMVRRRPAETR